MNQTLAVTKVEAVEEIGPGIFEVRVLLEDASTATLRMNGPTLCSLADMVSQYATPLKLTNKPTAVVDLARVQMPEV
jgi:hypothetical protein